MVTIYICHFLFVYMTWVPVILLDTCTYCSLFLLHCPNNGDMRYMVYMRVSLFGFFLQRINLMNSKSEPVQLVLSTLVFITSLDASLHAYVCPCTRHTFHVHMCLFVHSTWLHFTYSWDCFRITPGSACPDFGAWSLWILSVVDQSSAVKVWIINRPSGDHSSSSSCSALEILCCCS